MGNEPEDLTSYGIPQFEDCDSVNFCSVECMMNLCTRYLIANTDEKLKGIQKEE